MGAPRLLLLPTLVTRSQAMPSLFGHWGHPEPGSSRGPVPFSAVVRPRRQTPRAPPVAGQGVPSLLCFPQLLALPWRSCKLARASLSHSSGPPLTTPLYLLPSNPLPLGEGQSLVAQRPAGILDPALGTHWSAPALFPYSSCWAHSRVSLPILAVTESVLEFLKA